MVLQIPKPGTVFDYVPKFGGNRGKEDPCVVRVRYVPFVKLQFYRELIATKQLDPTVTPSEARRAVEKKQFLDNIVGVQDYFVGGVEISNVEEFYKTAPLGLIRELFAAMKDPALLREGAGYMSKDD